MKLRVLTSLGLLLAAALSGAAQQRIAASPKHDRTIAASDSTSSSASAVNMDEAITRITAWRIDPILGTRTPQEVDTLLADYAQSVAIPALQFGPISAITGNLGAEGIDMNLFTRPLPHTFFFTDALGSYIPSVDKTTFFNNRVPMTLLSYNTGGGSDQTQDRLRGTFNGNINRRAQVGAWVDYLHSKGSYDNQAAKHFNWGFNGSYLGDHYQVQAIYNQYYSLNKENGGIQDDLYITDPAEIQGGNGSISTKNIPVNLQNAHSRINGRQIWMNNAWQFGFYDGAETDSLRTFTPVSRVFWTFDYDQRYHRFIDRGTADNAFWNQSYFSDSYSSDETRMRTLTNTLGIALMEGFNKWAKAGLSAFVQHEYAYYRQCDADSLAAKVGITPRATEHSLYLGGRLAKEQGNHLHYSADARIGIAGHNIGEMDLSGDLELRMRMRSDTASLRAYAEFHNQHPSYFLEQYASNHFVWNQELSMTRRLRLGGKLDIPFTRTTLEAGMENVTNPIFFASDSRPVQFAGNVQIISATLRQDLKLGIFNWQNLLTYQTSTNSEVYSVPRFSVYSNAFLLFRIATLTAQAGVSCNYSTSYWAMGYQPATMSFYNQREIKVGNYPMMDAYINCKLSKVRFYVLYSHWNQGLFGGSNYFSAAHYPLNPRRFLFGLCVDFAN